MKSQTTRLSHLTVVRVSSTDMSSSVRALELALSFLLFSYSDKIPQRKQLKGERPYVGLQLQRDGPSLQGSHDGGNRKVAGCTESVLGRHRVRKK